VARVALAEAHRRQHKADAAARALEEAVTDLKKAIGLKPDEYQAHVTLAKAYQQQKRDEEAGRALDEAVRLRPDLPAVYRARAEWRRGRGDLEEARGDLVESIRRAAAEGNPAALAGDQVESGRIRHLQGRHADAVACYDSALRILPGHALAHHLRGEALLALNRDRDAERAFGECLAREPTFAPALRARGSARMRLADYAGAAEDYSQALRQEPGAEMHAHRGWAYFLADAWKLALRDFEEALRLDAGRSDASVGRGLSRVMLGDYRGGVADAEGALRRKKPDSPEMLHNVACIFAQAAARVRADATEGRRRDLEARYGRQAVVALRAALSRVPPRQRPAFWQEKMRPDQALDPIRGVAEFIDLDRGLVR
jgi:tetratricopeptide (TPR) repeat protein